MKKSLAEQNLGFFGWWSKFYGYDPVSLWLEFVQKKTMNRIQLNSDAAVVDIGCGRGKGLEFLRSRGFTKLYGADISPAMLEKATERLKETAVVKQADVENLPFRNNMFDVATNTEAFHHFPNPEKAMKEIKRVLKPGGIFYLADLNFFSRIIHWLFKKLEPGHIKIYSRQEFAELFTKAGFEIVEQKRMALFVILTVGKKII